MTGCTARSFPTDDRTTLTRSAGECWLKAAEQDAHAAKAPEGPIRDSFLQMADDWRRLARAKPALMNLWR